MEDPAREGGWGVRGVKGDRWLVYLLEERGGQDECECEDR